MEQMAAGQTITFTADWNWVDANYSKDWSVTAWGSKGNVTITHKNGLNSDKLPYIEPAATTGGTTTGGTTGGGSTDGGKTDNSKKDDTKKDDAKKDDAKKDDA